jgi:hypothetical protein
VTNTRGRIRPGDAAGPLYEAAALAEEEARLGEYNTRWVSHDSKSGG